MPTYEYQCEKGHTFDRVQKMTDKPVKRCPVCGAKASRVISGGQGLIFKGSGFYITDYGKDGKGPRNDPQAATSEPAKPEKSADASSAPATGKPADAPAAKATPAADKKLESKASRPDRSDRSDRS